MSKGIYLICQNKSNVCEVARVDGKFKAMFQSSQKGVFNTVALHRDSENQEVEIKVSLTLPIYIFIFICICVCVCLDLRYVYARAHANKIEKNPSSLNGAACTSAGLFTDILKIP